MSIENSSKVLKGWQSMIHPAATSFAIIGLPVGRSLLRGGNTSHVSRHDSCGQGQCRTLDNVYAVSKGGVRVITKPQLPDISFEGVALLVRVSGNGGFFFFFFVSSICE